jgi:MoaA/NifB/PqqE/SkfB family radical SAM enzyme
LYEKCRIPEKLWRLDQDMSNRFFFNIDVIGSCNLECPSCPMGNSIAVKNPKGAMSVELLQRIMEKAVSECELDGVGLFNWTEPLLHYDIANLVRVVKSFGVACRLSTNLNILKNVDELMKAEPTSLRVSVSGFRQESYGRTHAGGDIERVKANMIQLAEARTRTGSSTQLEVLYHRYLGNLDEEVEFRRFATDLGYVFRPAWAFMMPLEKTMAYLAPDEIDVKLTESDHSTIGRLALSLREASEAAMRYKARPCVLQDEQMTMDFQGNVVVCCALFDSSKYGLGSYLDTPLAELQAAKHRQDICRKCTSLGLHVYSVYGAPEFDAIALRRVGEYYAEEAGLNLPTMPGQVGWRRLIKRLLPPPLVRFGQQLLRR